MVTPTFAKTLKFADVKQKIGQHLKTALGIDEFSVTFAKLEENEWRVNVEFREKVGPTEWPTTALFGLDAETGEVKEFKKGYTWRF